MGNGSGRCGEELGRETGSNGEPFSALCHSSLDDISAIRSAHSREKSMRAFSLAFVRLIRPFHYRSSISAWGPFEFILNSVRRPKSKVQYSLRSVCCQAANGSSRLKAGVGCPSSTELIVNMAQHAGFKWVGGFPQMWKRCA